MLAQLLGLRRKFTVDGVRYRDVMRRSLGAAWSRPERERGQYEVQFASGATMRIEATPRRIFADISGPALLGPYRPAERLLRPGMRIVILDGGTGAVAEWGSHLVGSAGAVVALDRDAQSVAYAQRRYRLPNIAHEHGGVEALAGETDGSFDAALAVDTLRRDDDAKFIVGELWRTVASGGTLLLAAPAEAAGAEDDAPRAFSTEQLAALLESAVAGGPRPEQVSIFRRAARTYAVARRLAEE